MGNENTAIVDLLAGLNRKPLADDPTDDVLFAGSRRDPLAGPGRSARGTEPPPNLFAMPAPPPAPAPLPAPHLVVSLPRPFVNMPSAGVDQHLATVRVARTEVTAPNKKLYAVVGLLGIVAAVLAGIYVGRGDDARPPHVVASTAPAAHVDMPAPADEAAVAPSVTPSVTPIEHVAPPAAPTVTPIDSAAAAPSSPAPGETVAPAEVVPASAFVAKAETTVPTVASADAEAPAAEEPAAVAPAKKVKKSRRELARERRAAKRASKRGAKRERRSVAAAARSAKADKVDKKLDGKGALSISSKQPREVWVDGRNSKRMTPLRVLLKPGKHKVTLFDKAKGTAKTFEVEIKPNVTTKVAK